MTQEVTSTTTGIPYIITTTAEILESTITTDSKGTSESTTSVGPETSQETTTTLQGPTSTIIDTTVGTTEANDSTGNNMTPHTSQTSWESTFTGKYALYVLFNLRIYFKMFVLTSLHSLHNFFFKC